jgi:phosphatidylinositol glycan class Z
MWTRAYLVLVAVRLYFALSPSYIHPDENFQGPEVIAGMSDALPLVNAATRVGLSLRSGLRRWARAAGLHQIRVRSSNRFLTFVPAAGNIFDFPHHLTWEFSAAEPVRSVFPLWPAYGLPMVILRWLWTETGKEEVAPKIIYYTLRVVMFIASFVLEDWAIHELVPSPRQRRIAIILVASSYVTWTYQTHTFSNSIETIVVLWSLVLIQRILDDKVCMHCHAPLATNDVPSNGLRFLRLVSSGLSWCLVFSTASLSLLSFLPLGSIYFHIFPASTLFLVPIEGAA